MKLKPGQTVHHSGKKYQGEVPDDIAEAVGLKTPPDGKPVIGKPFKKLPKK